MVNQENKVSSLEAILDYIPTGKPVVSVYLMVDRSRVIKKDYQTRLNSMAASTREKFEADTDFDKSQKKEVFGILEKVKAYVNDKFRAGSTRTVAIFSSEDGLWEEFRIPIIMRSKIIVDPKPYTQNIRRTAYKQGEGTDLFHISWRDQPVSCSIYKRCSFKSQFQKSGCFKGEKDPGKIGGEAAPFL